MDVCRDDEDFAYCRFLFAHGLCCFCCGHFKSRVRVVVVLWCLVVVYRLFTFTVNAKSNNTKDYKKARARRAYLDKYLWKYTWGQDTAQWAP